MNMIIMEITAASTRVRLALRELENAVRAVPDNPDIQVLVRLQAFDNLLTSEDTSMAVLLCCLVMEMEIVSLS